MWEDQSTDPWEMICRDIGFEAKSKRFVSPTIPSEVIRKYGTPSKLIPIYSREKLENNHPFLKAAGLTPLRTGRGEAVLTKAELFRDILSHPSSDVISVAIPKEDSDAFLHFLNSTPSTESKYLSLAFNYGVFAKGLGINCGKELKLGIFGKMNLEAQVIELVDFTNNNRSYRVPLENVQFELDLSLETEDTIFSIEAKAGSERSFSVLQLFYPHMFLEEYARRSGKKIRDLLVSIKRLSKHEILYRFLEFEFNKKNVPNMVDFKGESDVTLRTGLQGKLL